MTLTLAETSASCWQGESFLTCGICDLALPLFLPENPEQGRRWECTGCGTVFFAELHPGSPTELLNNIRPADDEPAARPAAVDPPEPADQFHSVGTARTACADRTGVTCDAENTSSRQLDGLARRPSMLRVEPRGQAFLASVNREHQGMYDKTLQREMVEAYHDSTYQVDELFECISSGHSRAVERVPEITENALLKAADDLDLFVCLGINPTTTENLYPNRHSLHVAMLAMAVAANMEWDQRSLTDLGIGCLLHDVGMRHVKGAIYQQRAELSWDEFAEVARHPVYTFEMLEDHVDVIPLGARMVAYQMHERCDGSGYPRGRDVDQIHDMAKIAAVADVFFALVSPRPHRPGMMPYYAIERLLYGVKARQFDGGVVRALLHTVSLFPVGSFVELNDGSIGKVLRSNREKYDRPVLEVFDPGGHARVVDLDQVENLRVVRPIADIGRASG